jgi:hypothetical protein
MYESIYEIGRECKRRRYAGAGRPVICEHPLMRNAFLLALKGSASAQPPCGTPFPVTTPARRRRPLHGCTVDGGDCATHPPHGPVAVARVGAAEQAGETRRLSQVQAGQGRLGCHHPVGLDRLPPSSAGRFSAWRTGREVSGCTVARLSGEITLPLPPAGWAGEWFRGLRQVRAPALRRGGRSRKIRH